VKKYSGKFGMGGAARARLYTVCNRMSVHSDITKSFCRAQWGHLYRDITVE